MNWELTHGQVVVNAITHVHNTKYFHVWEIDFSSKRPMPSLAYSGDEVEVSFFAVSADFAEKFGADQTLDADFSTEETTKFTLNLGEDKYAWRTTVDGAKYTYTIIAWRYPEEKS